MQDKDFVRSGYFFDTDNSAPSATVIVNCYNHAPYIADCLDGILLQQVDFPFEVIISDDFSTDGSREIIQDYIRRFPAIFKASFMNYNTGGPACFLNSLSKATGKYLFIIDGDDFYIHTKCMQSKVNFLEINRGVHMCCSHLLEFYCKNFKIIREKNPNEILFYSFEDLFHFFSCGNISRNCFRMNTLRSYGPLPNHMYYDFPMALLMANKGLVAKLPEYHSVYRVTGKGIWSGLSAEERARQGEEVRARCAAFFLLPSPPAARLVDALPDKFGNISGKELIVELMHRIRRKISRKQS